MTCRRHTTTINFACVHKILTGKYIYILYTLSKMHVKAILILPLSLTLVKLPELCGVILLLSK